MVELRVKANNEGKTVMNMTITVKTPIHSARVKNRVSTNQVIGWLIYRPTHSRAGKHGYIYRVDQTYIFHQYHPDRYLQQHKL